MKNQKTNIIAIALIMAAMASALFLVVNVTAVFVTAYIVLLIGISGLCFGSFYLIASKKSYPWFASFPITIWRYLITQILVSAIVVISENFAVLSIQLSWFILIHVILLGFFSSLLILQKGGKDIIQPLEERAKEKYADFRLIQLDVETIKARVPNQAEEIQAVIDALRYSLPTSHDSIAQYENKIKDSVVMLEQAAESNDNAKISELCNTLLRQIKDRNNRAKTVK